jgi:hypothetical protein
MWIRHRRTAHKTHRLPAFGEVCVGYPVILYHMRQWVSVLAIENGKREPTLKGWATGLVWNDKSRER